MIDEYSASLSGCSYSGLGRIEGLLDGEENGEAWCIMKRSCTVREEWKRQDAPERARIDLKVEPEDIGEAGALDDCADFSGANMEVPEVPSARFSELVGWSMS